jgi:hypothetical protein
MREQPSFVRFLVRFLLSVVLATTATPGWAAVRDVSPEEAAEIEGFQGETRATGRATLGGRVGEHLSEGYLDVLQPLAGGERGLLFFNPKLSGSDNDEEEYSLGLGFRVLCPAVEAIAGANVFYDSRDSRHGHTYDQVGAGLEVLTTWVDARANYYWPDDKTELIESQSDTEVDRETDYSLSDIYAEGHELLQLERIKTTTTTTTRYYERFEAALEGYDVELGVKLPFLPDWMETRVFAGYYNFEGDFTEDIDGLKGRLEIRALPALTLDAEVYDNDDLTGSDYFFGARVNLPFDVVNLAHGRNPFAGTEAAFQARRVAFRERLSEMVIRDPHVRLHESGYLENEELKDVDVDVDESESELVVLDDINFVRNSNTSGFENGTDEHPYNTVQEGVDNVFGEKNVYVYQGTGAYHENVTINEDGVSLLGEGCAIEGYGGKKFGGGKFPQLDGQVGGVNGPVIRVRSDDVLIRGFEITRTPGGAFPGQTDGLGLGLPIDMVGVLAENADNLTIECNRFINQMYGVLGLYDATEADAPVDLNLQVLENNFDDTTFGVQLYGRGPGGRFSSLVMDNTFDDLAAFDVYADLALLDDVTLNVLGNRFLDPVSTIFVSSAIVANDLTLNLDGNRFEQGGNMVVLSTGVQGDAALSLSGNEMLGPSVVQVTGPALVNGDLALVMDDNFIQNGLILATPGSVAGDAFISISGNTLLDASGGAITLVTGPTSGRTTLRLDNNRIVDPLGAGITAVATSSGGDFQASISGNDISGAQGGGATLVSAGIVNDFSLDLSNNRIVSSAGSGLFASSGPVTGDVVAVAAGNQINTNAGGGLFLSLGPVSGDASLAVLDSEFIGNGGSGLTLFAPTVLGTLDVLIDPTSANRNGGDGMTLALSSVGDLALTLEDVTANDNLGLGLNLSASSSSGSVQAAFLEVEASRNGVGGMIATLAANQDLILGRVAPVPVGNRITANGNAGGYGIFISGFSVSGQVVSLTERMQTSTNVGGGSFRDLQAAESVNVVDGEVEANNNLGQGMALIIESTNAAAIYQVGRLEANSNVGGGANLTLVGRESATAFLGLESPISVLPPPAQGGLVLNNNIGGGLTATMVSEEGGAGGGIGKTEASGNIGNGLSFNVIAEEQASLFLGLAEGSLTNGTEPVVANNNAGNGISVNLFSASGSAMLLLLGNGSANNNGGSGVQATLNAASDVIMGVGSVPFGGGIGSLGAFEASGNQQVGVGLSGTSTGSSAQVILAGLAANSNVLDGVNVEATGLDGAQIVAGSYLVTDSAIETLDNGGVGLRVNSTAAAGSALVLLSDMNASGNASNGVSVNLSARDKITMVLGLGTDGGTNIFVVPVVANNNGASGLELSANSASGDVEVAAISFIANSNTSYGLDANLKAYSNITVVLGDLNGLIPIPVTNFGGSGQMIGNGLGGLRLAATSFVGSVTAAVGNVTANNNAGPGAAADISLTAAQDVTASLFDSEFNGNTSAFGLRLQAQSRGATRSSRWKTSRPATTTARTSRSRWRKPEAPRCWWSAMSRSPTMEEWVWSPMRRRRAPPPYWWRTWWRTTTSRVWICTPALPPGRLW